MSTTVELKNSNIDLAGAVIPRANLSRSNLAAANLEGANLSSSDLSFAILVNSRMANSNLEAANLTNANLSGADLTTANFVRADLGNAKLISTNLDRTKLSGANLRSANLKDAQNVTWAQLLEAHIDEQTIFPDEFGGDSVFSYLDQVFPLSEIDLRSEAGGSLMTFLQMINEQIQVAGRDWTIGEFLRELSIHQNYGDSQVHVNRTDEQ